MFYNHLFWTTQALLFSSALNTNAYLEFRGTNKILGNSIGAVGVLGLLAGSVRFIKYSVQHNWWWFFGGMSVFLLLVGVFSYFFRNKIRDVLGIANLLIIPFLWWYGSRFNTLLSAEWFYDLIEGISGFFA